MVVVRALLDTNIFLEWLLGQERADACRLLLSKVKEGKVEAFVSDFALHSIAVILEREGKTEDLKELFIELDSFESLTLLHASLEEYAEIVRTGMGKGLDFDDAYQAYLAKQEGISIVSFDSHFDGILERWTPEDLLRKA